MWPEVQEQVGRRAPKPVTQLWRSMASTRSGLAGAVTDVSCPRLVGKWARSYVRLP